MLAVGGSDEPVIIVLPLVAVEVDGDRLVTSSLQLLVVGPACERIANERHTACTCAVNTVINHKHKYAHQHKIIKEAEIPLTLAAINHRRPLWVSTSRL